MRKSDCKEERIDCTQMHHTLLLASLSLCTGVASVERQLSDLDESKAASHWFGDTTPSRPLPRSPTRRLSLNGGLLLLNGELLSLGDLDSERSEDDLNVAGVSLVGVLWTERCTKARRGQVRHVSGQDWRPRV